MLTPLAPDPRDPRYREQLAQYRRDLAAMRDRPADWGAVHPRRRPRPAQGRRAGRHGRRQP